MRPGHLALGYAPRHCTAAVLPIAVEVLYEGVQRVLALRCVSDVDGAQTQWVLMTWITSVSLWKERDAC
jgi:hypothetical protein